MRLLTHAAQLRHRHGPLRLRRRGGRHHRDAGRSSAARCRRPFAARVRRSTLLAAEFFIPLRALGSFFHTAMNGMAAADKMYAILDAPEPQARLARRRTPPIASPSSCRGVGYSYDGERTVLADVDFAAAARLRSSGVVGESGSGQVHARGRPDRDANAGFSGVGRPSAACRASAACAAPRLRATDHRTCPFNELPVRGHRALEPASSPTPSATDDELWEALRPAAASDGFVRAGRRPRRRGRRRGRSATSPAASASASRWPARLLRRHARSYVFDEATVQRRRPERGEPFVDVHPGARPAPRPSS